MEKFNIAILLLSILVALSGWATLGYQVLTSKPKLIGRVFNVIIGEIAEPEIFNGHHTSFLTYLYIINERKNSVHILDYELEIDVGNGFERLYRAYGVQNIQNWGFLSDKYQISIPDFTNKLIYAENRPVEYGTPLHGFVVFTSEHPKSDYVSNMENNKYRLTIIDAFQNKYVFTVSPDTFPSLFLLQDLAGINFTPLN
ncbi:MAG TPA: hypothetical protein G4O16_01985 [Dehalococcoidia bacterium]|nr:hypothetical protein [Dehalococcoidia bacterium]